MKLPPQDTHFKDPHNYQRTQYDLLLKHTTQRRTALDIGAHIGIFTLRFAQDFQETWAWEPLNYEYLQANTGDIETVYSFPYAISNNSQDTYAYNPKHSNTGAWELTQEPTQYKVKTRTLDSYKLHTVDAVKIDTQKHELAVLQGAVNTLKTNTPTLLIEDVNKKVLEFLQQLNYKMVEKHNKDSVWIVQ